MFNRVCPISLGTTAIASPAIESTAPVVDNATGNTTTTALAAPPTMMTDAMRNADSAQASDAASRRRFCAVAKFAVVATARATVMEISGKTIFFMGRLIRKGVEISTIRCGAVCVVGIAKGLTKLNVEVVRQSQLTSKDGSYVSLIFMRHSPHAVSNVASRNAP